MKLFYRSLMAAYMLLVCLCAKGQGWPANYEGVMLQGFYWDSYGDTKWTVLKSQANELSKYFDLIWIPNSASSDNGMGYMPVYWFSNYNSRFGTEDQLKDMIKAFKDKGTGFIADVVVNHRNGNNSAWDFPSETYNGKVYDMADGSIVSNDNIWSSTESWAKGVPESYKGNPDTGDRFDGCRDLDHTNETVQEHIKAYTSFLLNELNYVGFRYDMVKGYDAQYTKIYNEYSKPTFSVGEYWDNYDPIVNWIEKTGKTSAAFDFPCKTQLNAAFNNGMNLGNLTWVNLSTGKDQPAGLIHQNYKQYAVTFVDNHDTYRDSNKFSDENHVLAANAFILSSPGTPCVFLKHYLDYPLEIKQMINARKSAGIQNTSEITVFTHTATCYLAEIKGSRGTLAVKIGSDFVSPSGYTDSDIYTSGKDYCIWVKSDGSYDAPVPTPGTDTPVENGITIYYDNSATHYDPVFCYSFADHNPNGNEWPGYRMTNVSGDIYSVAVPQGSSVVFSNGADDQTVDVLNVKEGYIYKGLSETDSQSHSKVSDGELWDGTIPLTALYLNGNFDSYTGDWYPDKAKEMPVESGNYVLRNVKMNGSSGKAYFSFADRQGDWTYVNAGTRYGAANSDGEAVTAIKDSNVTSPSYKMVKDNQNAWSITNGNYDIVVDPTSWKLTVYEAGKAPNFNESKDPEDDQKNPNEENKDPEENKPGDNKPSNPGDNKDDQNQGTQPPAADEDNNPQTPDDDNQGDQTPDDSQPGNDPPEDENHGTQPPAADEDNNPQTPDDDNQGEVTPDDSQPGNDPAEDENHGTQPPAEDEDNNPPTPDDDNQGDQTPDDDNTPGDEGDEPGNDGDDNIPGDENPDAGIDGIQAEDMETEYYTLQGFKVQNPDKGIYIKVTGNKREKIVIR